MHTEFKGMHIHSTNFSLIILTFKWKESFSIGIFRCSLFGKHISRFVKTIFQLK